MLFSCALRLGIIITTVVAKTHTFHFTAAYLDANPDGLFTKKVIGFNGQWPLPTIHVDKGDRVEIFLTNGLETKNTSLHFHGLFQNGSSHMDGPEMVTQCPIPPNSTYLYNFTVEHQAGSFWYHSHSGAQYGDGMRGAFIIHEPLGAEPFEYDEEHVLTLSENYHGQYDAIGAEFLNRYNPTGAEPIPNSLLIDDTTNISLFFTPGKTYLLRFINVGLFVSQYIEIEGHDLIVVEVDGVYVEPTTVRLLYIAVGQRYTILVQAKQHATRNYAIAQRFDDTMLDVIPPELKITEISHLVYDETKPLSQEYTIKDLGSALNDFELTTSSKTPLLEDYDFQITLEVIMENLGDGVNYAFFNNITYVAPVVPTLITALTSGEDATNSAIYGSNINAFVLQKDEVVEIVVNNQDDGRHPFHLHGHTFQVIQKSPAFDEPTPYNENNHKEFPQFPVSRDTTVLEGNGHTVLRFKADNPGIWFFHCHVDWHLEQGLAAVFIEDPLALQSQRPPDDFFEICKEAGIPTQGNAAGNLDLFDLSNENKQPLPLPPGFTTKGYIAFVISTVIALYGLYSIVQYGLEDSINDDTKIFKSLERILKEHGLFEEEAPEIRANETTRLSSRD